MNKTNYLNPEDLENMSIKQLESTAVEIYQKQERRKTTREESVLLERILYIRRNKLNCKFKWNKENVKKILWVNEKLIACLKKAKAEAQAIDKILMTRLKNGDKFLSDYDIEIRLIPFTLVKDKSGYMLEPVNNIYEALPLFFDERFHVLRMSLEQVTRKDNLYFSKDLNWNIESLGTPELAGSHIYHALHELCDHCPWSVQDILKINEFWAEVKINITHISEKLYCGFVDTEHYDFVKIKKVSRERNK
jgi:hypothetical protein